MRVDTHQHFWRYDAQEYDWISEDMSVLKQDFLPDQLAIELERKAIAGCIAVQARQSLQETRWLLSLAVKHPMILGVVGWIDLCDDNLPSVLKEFDGNGLLKGFRHVLQDEKDADFMLQPAFIKGLKTLAEHGYSYDILINSGQLPQVCQLVKQLPEMRLVLDHIAKPDISAGQWQDWQEYMRYLSTYPHVYCKVSGMITEANWHHWKQEDIRPYWEHVHQCFGSKRLMYGSDWPVCQLAGSYETVHDLMEKLIDETDPLIKASVMGENAERFYQLTKEHKDKAVNDEV